MLGHHGHPCCSPLRRPRRAGHRTVAGLAVLAALLADGAIAGAAAALQPDVAPAHAAAIGPRGSSEPDFTPLVSPSLLAAQAQARSQGSVGVDGVSEKTVAAPTPAVLPTTGPFAVPLPQGSDLDSLMAINDAVALRLAYATQLTDQARSALAAAQDVVRITGQARDLADAKVREQRIVVGRYAAEMYRYAVSSPGAYEVLHFLYDDEGSAQSAESARAVATVGAHQATRLRELQAAQAAAADDFTRAEAGQAQASAALDNAVAVQRVLSVQLTSVTMAISTAVTAEQVRLSDLAAAGYGSQDQWAPRAAVSLRAQALATKAAAVTDFPLGASPAVTISIATAALLRRAQAGSAGMGTPLPDQTPLMGPAPAALAFKSPAGSGRTTAFGLGVWDGQAVAGLGAAGVGLGGQHAGAQVAPVQQPNGVTVSPVVPARPVTSHPLRASVAIDEALRQIGKPYVWAAAGPASFDCSGLVMWSYGHAGLAVDHLAHAQYQQGVVLTSPQQLLPGDLLFFGDTRTKLHHVGIYLGAGFMLDAPYTGAYVRVEPVARFDDLAGATRL